MFPGRRKKEAKARAEKMRVAFKNSPEAMTSLKQALVGQMMSMLGTRVFEWVGEKNGRRFIMMNESRGEEEGVALIFEEDGKEVTPGFIK